MYILKNNILLGYVSSSAQQSIVAVSFRPDTPDCPQGCMNSECRLFDRMFFFASDFKSDGPVDFEVSDGFSIFDRVTGAKLIYDKTFPDSPDLTLIS